MKSIQWILTDENITVNFDGQTHQFSRTENTALADKIIMALKEKRNDDIPNLISAEKKLMEASNGAFTLRDGQVFINGKPAHNVVGAKIKQFHDEGLPYEPLVKFAENLDKNPSFRAVNELYTFLEKNNHPITENGNFIAYKKVGNDFLDLHSKTIDNSVGKTVEMPRNQVNENQFETCSYGLHVANWHYAANCYGSPDDTMLEVEVNPADVVSVPVDYENAKMRVCKYVVLSVVEQELSTALRVTSNASSRDFGGADVCDYESDSDDDYEDSYQECRTCYTELVEDEGEGGECYDCAEESQDEKDEEKDDLDCDCEECEDDDEYPWESEV